MLRVDIKKQLANFTLDINFTVGNNILVLFGPSGSGKTTVLRSIAGLIKPDEGNITYHNKVLFSSRERVFVPPHCRRVGYMFQEYALFPHMNVKSNVCYGVQGCKEKAEDLYIRIMETLKIKHLELRFIDRLSGGEKQRVALARALMAEPEILLLDEPLSSLDEKTRAELQIELRKLQKNWSIPFILVTHDYVEAKAMGDKFIFIDQGREATSPDSWGTVHTNDKFKIPMQEVILAPSNCGVS